MSEFTKGEHYSYILNTIGYNWVSTVRPEDVEYLEEAGVEGVRIEEPETNAARACARAVIELLRERGVDV